MGFAPLTAYCLLTLIWVQNVRPVALWEQCGGIGYSGSDVCDSGAVCTYFNDYYSQCLPSATSISTSTSNSLMSSITPSSTRPTTTSPASVPTVSCLAQGMAKGSKFWGVHVITSSIIDPSETAIIQGCFNLISPDDAFTWTITEPTPGYPTFNSPDYYLKYAVANSITLWPCLCVNQNIPATVGTVTDRSTLVSILQNHVAAIVNRYQGKIPYYTIVNEVLNDDGTIRPNVFYNKLGLTFFNVAFSAARAADPNAKLYINDYGLDSMTSAKTVGMLNLVKMLLSQGVPIDGIGSEAHLSAGQVGSTVMAAALNKLSSIVSQVAITALDITGAAPADYVQIVHGCLAIQKCVGIISAAVSDADVWVTSIDAELWDTNYAPKPAVSAVLAIL